MSESVNLPPKKTVRRRAGHHMSKAERTEAQDKFVEAFANAGIVLVGCRAAGVTRQTVDYWLEHDVEFSFKYNNARREADDRIRLEIWRRATTLEKASDTLLIFLAKSRMPEFRDRVELDATGAPVAPRKRSDGEELAPVEFTLDIGEADGDD